MNAPFKTYVVRVHSGRAVFETRIQLALADEVDTMREGTPPDLRDTINDEQLLKIIGEGSWMHKDLTERAMKGGGILTPAQVKELDKAGLTGAGSKVHVAPKAGSPGAPVLLNENPAPDTAAVRAGVERYQVVTLDGPVTAKELNFLKRNWSKLKGLFS